MLACGMSVANIVVLVKKLCCPVLLISVFIRLAGKVERRMASRNDGSIPAAVPPIRRRGRRKHS